MGNIRNLIHILEEAEEGGLQIDRNIAEIYGYTCVVTEGQVRFEKPAPAGSKFVKTSSPAEAHAYSTDIDVALRLLPKSVNWRLERRADKRFFAEISRPAESSSGNSSNIVSATASTPALAICIAALKARR